MSVLDRLLRRLIAELDDGAVVAIALTGSHARGEANPYSDVDMLRFLHTPPEKESQRYTLEYRDGHLISTTTTTIAAKREEMARPEKAIWAVPGLRQSRIVLDREGALARLKEEAEAFTWEPLRPVADEYASYTVMGDAEEVHKVLGALARGDDSAVLYGNLGLYLGLTRAVAVQQGILAESENSYFRQVQDAVGQGSAWTRWHRLAGGFEPGPPHISPVRAQGIAGLHLYEETVGLVRHVLRTSHVDVIENTLAAIRGSGLAAWE